MPWSIKIGRVGEAAAGTHLDCIDMREQRIFLVRHGEVDNPEHVLYERLPGYGLSARGTAMAQRAADYLVGVTDDPKLVVSPLQRTRESMAPIEHAFGATAEADERVIEPWNRFAGTRITTALKSPRNWPLVRNPLRPSWGEPFSFVAERMLAALREQAVAAAGRDVIVVSHQLPIWMVHRAVTQQRLAHHPGRRRCALSSVTTLQYHPATDLQEIDYCEPAAELLVGATDLGAV